MLFTGKTMVHMCTHKSLSCRIIIITELTVLSHFLLWLIHNEVVKIHSILIFKLTNENLPINEQLAQSIILVN